MPSALAATFNKVPNFSNFQALAQGNPAEAKAVLSRLTQGLSKSGVPEQLAQLEALLAAQEAQLGGLTANSPALKALFPDAPGVGTFAECIAQMSNLQTLNWTADAAPPQVAVTGNVKRNEQNQYVMATGGREYLLVESSRTGHQLGGGWMEGFLNNGEGPMTVQGTVSPDGKSFNVEGYAPGSNPDFVYGRVAVKVPLGAINSKPTPEQIAEVMGPNGVVTVNTARGAVEVKDPALKQMLAHVPGLGVILPGKTSKDANGNMSTDAKSEFLYALGGRFAGLTEKGNGVFETTAAFASHKFQGPVICEGETAKWRMQNSHNERNWVGGTFKFDDTTPHFAAKYISNDLGTYQLTGTQSEGPAALQLLAAAEVVDPANDFSRAMGPPG